MTKVKLGWESVSIPFEAELVTTQQKGEITHFYGNSTKGHEYWLREFKGGKDSTNDATIFVADFQKPGAGRVEEYYTNTFLWDYYYSYDSYWDVHQDEYQKTYYKDEHVYSGYPYSAAGAPYIIGLPGNRYYEFDLSGTFNPKNTHKEISRLSQQEVIFASEPGISIAVSDDELTPVKASGYQFQPNYSNTTLRGCRHEYVLAADGGSFDKNAASAVVEAFRPYFVTAATGTRGVSSDIERIVFGEDDSKMNAELSTATRGWVTTAR